MKRFISFVFLSSIVLMGTFAQKRIFIFEKFVPAKVKLLPRGVITYVMNYDANGGKMYFMQGEEMMELTATANVDTITWGTRKFVPAEKRFQEVVKLDHGTVNIDWHLRDVWAGNKGALGVATQANVQALRLSDFADINNSSTASAYQSYREQNVHENEITKRKCENIYYFKKDGKDYSVKSLKNIYKYFPDKTQQIKDYIQSNKLDIIYTDEALQIIDYVLSL